MTDSEIIAELKREPAAGTQSLGTGTRQEAQGSGEGGKDEGGRIDAKTDRTAARTAEAR